MIRFDQVPKLICDFGAVVTDFNSTEGNKLTSCKQTNVAKSFVFNKVVKRVFPGWDVVTAQR